MSGEVAFWQGEFGNDYIARNDGAGIEARVALWSKIMYSCMGPWPETILEIGAGSGDNLIALRRVYVECFSHYGENFRLEMSGVEPNAKARAMLEKSGFKAFDGTAENPGRTAELAFASGVLIHIPPDELLAACRGIYDAAERYIVTIEYFSADPEDKVYRGHSGKLWKRDFGGYWLDNFELEPLGCGFAWKRMTGLDNVTWWAFRKCV